MHTEYMPAESRPASAFKQYLPSDYRKRTVYVYLNVAPGKANVTSYWDGGSRAYFTLFPKGRGPGKPVSREPGFPTSTRQEIDLGPGDVLVEAGIFLGKPSTARITFVAAS